MTKQYHVSYAKANGFQVIFVEHSGWRDAVVRVVDAILCVPFGHRFEWQYTLCDGLHRWAWRHEQELATVDIDKAIAKKISRPEAWDWTDEE